MKKWSGKINNSNPLWKFELPIKKFWIHSCRSDPPVIKTRIYSPCLSGGRIIRKSNGKGGNCESITVLYLSIYTGFAAYIRYETGKRSFSFSIVACSVWTGALTLRFLRVKLTIFYYQLFKHMLLVLKWCHLDALKTVLLSTHNKCFDWEIRKLILYYALLTKYLNTGPLAEDSVCLFDLNSTIFQLCLDGSSLVEPILSKD